MRAVFSGLLAGLIFGAGLALSGMIDPARVLGFLDIAGHWDPRLAFVLAGAVIVSFGGVRLARRRAAPLLAAQFQWPDAAARIDRRLLAGAALFGLGWGIAGFCPGPAIAAAGQGIGGAILFTLAMLVGMALYQRFES
ncbi:MAG: YeeE/YedE family protein [Rhodospirillales bacterium]|nr:YeeE/YedE family protein [Rhodospirillales bacterium]